LPIYILGFFQLTNSQTAVVWHLCPSGPFCCRGHTNIKNSNVLNRTLARQLRLVVMAEIWNVKSGYQWQSLWHLGPSLSDPRSGKRNMPIPSPYRLTSYLLLKCSLSPFGVPWNDRFVFNYYPYRINTTKKICWLCLYGSSCLGQGMPCGKLPATPSLTSGANQLPQFHLCERSWRRLAMLDAIRFKK
jgi:hypothetical protein